MRVRRSKVDYTKVRVAMEETPRMKDHKPAMFVAMPDCIINIIPSIAWDRDLNPVPLAWTLNHETIHITHFSLGEEKPESLDNLPPTTDLFLRAAGIYGWGLKRMTLKNGIEEANGLRPATGN